MLNSLEINLKPTETYGNVSATHTVKLTNGGAGPTGILRALAEEYLKGKENEDVNVVWLRNISRIGLMALSQGGADIGLTYERDHEEDFVAKYPDAKNEGCIFNDHFVLVGPKKMEDTITHGTGDEAIVQAFRDLAKTNSATIVTRDDRSATHCKELEVWKLAGVEDGHPIWSDQRYKRHTVFPHEALKLADEMNAFTMIDWGTWLTFGLEKTPNTDVFVCGGNILLNACHAIVLQQNVASKSYVKDFLEFMKSDRGQQVFDDFGKEKFGKPLFTPAKQINFADWK